MSLLQKRPREDEDDEHKENGVPSKRSRNLFTSEQEEKLMESFRNEQKITLKAAREFLREQADMFEGRTEKMIQDKWINMQKKLNRV